ncbi:TetR/AcrR family transcriptional regulator [Gordonia sp. C13]|uniref:TetR/AcrR family transcriptional regulator n=1 Tax=Gordonia sp. C13 TaxID=2935078 RepID=UPI00200B8FD4|nr:TetR/AcrR family transcriptional regulator [Gordonia sp. C13]MCK8615609.1 TetR/AcrR family transcriptional regulator [Gordonia sp. C13]
MNSDLWPEGASSTRERLLAAMLDCVAASGYRETTVADVVRVAQTSRRSFYQEFTDKQDCFFALVRRTTRLTIDEIARSVDPQAEPEDQVRQAVSSYVAASDRYPGLVLSWIRELPALGRPADVVKNEAVEEWVDLFVRLSSAPAMVARGIPPISRERAVFLWGGVRELTADAVESGAPLSEIIEPATAACLALVLAGGY